MDFYTIVSIILALAVIIGYINIRYIRMQTTSAITTGAMIISLTLIIIGKLGFGGIEEPMAAMLRQIPFSSIVLNGMLSFLLFAGALNIDIHYLRNQKWEIATLATLGTIASTILVATLVYFLLQLVGLPIKYVYCILFGALISPTDPIAVLATFRELGAPKKLKVIVEGEALFNDGVGIVIFLTIYQLVFTGNGVSFDTTFLLFLRQALGGIIYGSIIGITAYWFMKRIDDHKLEILITLLIVTAGYTLARLMNISGPLAMVVAGIFIGNRGRKFSMSKKTVESLDNFWELIEEILNAMLFCLIGLELLAIHMNLLQIIIAIITIPLVLLVRFIIVALPMSYFQRKHRYPPFSKSILIWGGLRGALAFALALSLPPNHYRNLILGMTYAVVAFAVIVQGISIKSLVKFTHPAKHTEKTAL